MSEHEFQTGVDEAVGMVRNGQRLPRKEVCFIPEKDVARLATADQQIAVLTQERDATAKELRDVQKKVTEYQTAELKQRIIHSIIQVIICFTWILGALEGLADPIFTGAATFFCVLWAAVSYKWGAANA